MFLYTRQDGHDARLASLKDAKAKEAKAKIGGGFCFFWIGNLEKEEEHFSDDKTYGKTTEILVCYFFLKFVFFMLKPFFWGSTRCIL